MVTHSEIIVAPATLSGGALAIVRISGKGAIELADGIFRGQSGSLTSARGFTLHYGNIEGENSEVIDDVMLSLFRSPHSFTGEDGVEISCHGSAYIVQQITELAISKGARMATAGEFTTRAFLAGKIDLSQAEAIADMIASTDRATHKLARTQMKGGYSERLASMREELVKLGALMELELDFSEEDVEFADRKELNSLIDRLSTEIEQLTQSFKVGNAIKKGVNVAIIGAPNAGKSTLLNRILGEDRAMVSNVAGTTRDSIEECIDLNGVTYRFIDTAGLHATTDELERMGIERTHSAIERAKIIIQLIDIDTPKDSEIKLRNDQSLIKVYNKIDKYEEIERQPNAIYISARDGYNIDKLLNRLQSEIDTESLYAGDIVVSNARHYEHLSAAHNSIEAAKTALNNQLPADLVVEDLRHTLHHIGQITGAITTDDLLHKIFSTFCIGK